MSNRRMARADLVTGAILFALASAVVTAAWNMDRLELRRIHPLSAPGVTPGLLGLALAVASLLLVARALRDGAMARSSDGDAGRSTWLDAGAWRLLGAVALSTAYALLLVGTLPYWLATAIYVAVFVAVFEWNDPGPRTLRLVAAGVIGLGTGLAVAYVFGRLFLVRLP